MTIQKAIYPILILLLFASCTKDSPFPPTPPTSKTRTLLVYMVADNNLSWRLESDQKNILAMQKSLDNYGLNNCNLLIYWDGSANTIGDYVYNGKPQLLQFKEDKLGKFQLSLLKEYEEQNSASIPVMKDVVSEIFKEDYEADSYGIILWSHGTAWLPIDYQQMTRSFGDDNSKHMEIYELAEALPDDAFDFIMFDACSMAALECTYELKDKADYIVASSAEVISDGFPYETMLPFLLADEADLDAAANDFYQFYNKHSFPYGCISVVKTDELKELSSFVKGAFKGKKEDVFYNLPYNDLQILSYLPNAPSPLYDFTDTMKHLLDAEKQAALETLMNKVVVSKYHTKKIIHLHDPSPSFVTVNTFCGLSFYPHRKNLTQINEWYKRLRWYQDTFQ